MDEASQREADRVYEGVRWLDFIVGLAPLLGLLGTVWGLILAFQDISHLSPSQNRVEVLSRGIYEALVTTLTGLLVAIPSAVFAHHFQGKIVRSFQKIELFTNSLLAKFEPFEGKRRFEVIGRELVVRSVDSSKSSKSGTGSSSNIEKSTESSSSTRSAGSSESHASSSREHSSRDTSGLVIPPIAAMSNSDSAQATIAIPPIQSTKKSKPVS